MTNAGTMIAIVTVIAAVDKHLSYVSLDFTLRNIMLEIVFRASGFQKTTPETSDPPRGMVSYGLASSVTSAAYYTLASHLLQFLLKPLNIAFS